MEFKDVLLTRRTTRRYLPEQIPDEMLDHVLQAAQTAPIAGADYTMTHITVVQNTDMMRALRESCTMKLPDSGEPVDAFYGAPTVLFLSGHGISKDCIEYSNIGCAIENMLLAATDLGLGSTYIWGCLRKLRKHPEIIATLALPEGYVLLSGVALGYPAEPLAVRPVPGTIGVNRI